MREYFFYVDHHGRLFQVLSSYMSEIYYLGQKIRINFLPGWLQDVSLDCSLKRREIAVQFFQEAKVQQHWKILWIQVFLASSFVLCLNVQILIRFLSLCGKERNFVRCDDRPIVFHNSKILPTPSGIVAAVKRFNSNQLYRWFLAPSTQSRWWETSRPLPAPVGHNGAKHRYLGFQ